MVEGYGKLAQTPFGSELDKSAILKSSTNVAAPWRLTEAYIIMF